MSLSALRPAPRARACASTSTRPCRPPSSPASLEPGTLITVPTLAVRFDVSATPVREAVLELEKRGFVETVRNKGFRVTAVSDEELGHLVQVRQLLEAPAMERLAGRVPDDALPALEGLADRIERGARDGDLRAYLEADQEFHLSLTRMLGNPVLTDSIADLRSRTRLVGLASMKESRHLDDSAAEHHELLRALVRGDGREAHAVMVRHIRHATGWWAGHGEEDGDARGDETAAASAAGSAGASAAASAAAGARGAEAAAEPVAEPAARR
ncbi:GntR family transcriptional regulator [Clavibacter tessellarius]|uniref:GntR family transcriptional regulator n=1 Tax=Clavibacter tessellarius TaxID=31965 RepID=UPI00325698D9